MIDPSGYELRKVLRWENEDGSIGVSTIRSTDTSAEFETALWHPHYNKGQIVIVEEYETAHKAREGHNAWVTRVKNDCLPSELQDVSSHFAISILRLIDADGDREIGVYPEIIEPEEDHEDWVSNYVGKDGMTDGNF